MNTLLIFPITSFILWLIGYIVVDKYGNFNSALSFIFKWYDGWIGIFYDREKRWIYIFPIPFFGIIIKTKRN